MKILVFDNYDSFTYNLVHMVEKITSNTVDVCYNDEIALEKIQDYDAIILSPGPGLPKQAGLLMPLIETYAPTKKILGVCLGHQAIGQVFGAQLNNLPSVYHGVATNINVQYKNANPKSYLFKGMPNNFKIGRYHSWVVDNNTLPQQLDVTAIDDVGLIMALQHKTYNLQSVQFQPESVLTPMGEQIIANWLKHNN